MIDDCIIYRVGKELQYIRYAGEGNIMSMQLSRPPMTMCSDIVGCRTNAIAIHFHCTARAPLSSGPLLKAAHSQSISVATLGTRANATLVISSVVTAIAVVVTHARGGGGGGQFD